jgi:sugar phosphate isomerase/epimerase
MFRTLSTKALGFASPQNEQIEMALSFGFESIDLDAADFAQQVETRGVDTARRLIKSAKPHSLKVAYYELPLSLDSDDGEFAQRLGELANQARLAAEVGCTRAVCRLSPGSNDRPMHDNFEFHRSRLLQVCRVLADAGAKLGVGFRAPASLRKDAAFEFIHDPVALAKLVEAVKADNIGLTVDLWDMYVAGQSVADLREIPADEIVCVYVSDAPANKAAADLVPEDRISPREDGAVDITAALAALNAMNYPGPVVLSVHSKHIQGIRRDQVVRELGRALDERWRAAGLTSRTHLPSPAVAGGATEEVEVEEVGAEEPEETAPPAKK